jgi:predicted NACHT family NTPase
MRQINKVNPRKEFFKVKLSEVKEEIEKLNITTGVKWTMTSEASEYRQTLAIESAIASDPQQKEKWIKRQLSLDSQDFENEENAED